MVHGGLLLYYTKPYSVFTEVSSPKFSLTGKLRSANRQTPRCKTGGAKGPSASISLTRQNAPGAVSPVCGHVVAAVVGGGVGPAIGVSRSRRIRPVPVAMAGVTIAG